MLDKIKRQPALVMALVQAVVYCATSFGLSLSDVQQGAVMALVAAVVAVVLPGIPADADAESDYEPQHKA